VVSAAKNERSSSSRRSLRFHPHLGPVKIISIISTIQRESSKKIQERVSIDKKNFFTNTCLNYLLLLLVLLRKREHTKMFLFAKSFCNRTAFLSNLYKKKLTALLRSSFFSIAHSQNCSEKNSQHTTQFPPPLLSL